MDLFVVPTISFDLLFAFVIVRLDRRALIWINVTRHPTAEWIARQITEAFPWNEAPRYLIRDRDRIFGAIVARRLRAMGIRGALSACAGDASPDADVQAEPSVDRSKFSRFDPSTGSQSQKTSGHPWGDALRPASTRDIARNRAFSAREAALIRNMQTQIERDNAARWK
jgi:hypothetical protein